MESLWRQHRNDRLGEALQADVTGPPDHGDQMGEWPQQGDPRLQPKPWERCLPGP